jgi:VWFA-related protein
MKFRRLAPVSLLLALSAAAADPPPAGAPAAAPPITLEDRVALARADGLFADVEASGELDVEAAFLVQAMGAGSGMQGELEVLVDLAPLRQRLEGGGVPGAGTVFRVSLVVEVRGEGARVVHQEVAAGDLGDAGWWYFTAPTELPEPLRQAAVVVEEPFSGLWGAAAAEPTDDRMEPPAAAAMASRPGVWSFTGEGGEGGGGVVAQAAGGSPGGPAPAPVPAAPAAATAAPAPAAATAAPATPGPAAERGTVVRLLPPRGHAEGSVHFETLVSDPDVARVVFSLDGKEVATSRAEPFDARIALAGPGHPQTVGAVAYGADDKWLGEDRLTLNDPVHTFRARLVRVEGQPAAGGVDVEAQVDVPSTARLDRVEIYFNDTLAARFAAPPYQTHVDTTGASGQDFIRVAAFLTDGTSVEDVRLLNARGVVEQVEVNLVELFVVVNDKEGHPVKDLGAGDFTVRQGGKPVHIERVSFASDVPLSLGLVIDTSASMQFIMNETKQAAAGFLSQVLGDGDRAFLVDFATRPRLRQPSTGDLMELIDSFRGMQAEGYTALFDAVIFSTLEFTDGPGRRALVLLTDGDDYKSHFGPNRAIQYARRTGVPVYVIVLEEGGGADLGPVLGGRRRQAAIRGSTRMELEAVTGQTGGRLYFADGVDALPGIYSEIDEELRSQYLLTYYSQSELSDADRRSIDVRTDRRGLDARTVVNPD